jgi:predicted GNAT family acetyltransferase
MDEPVRHLYRRTLPGAPLVQPPGHLGVRNVDEDDDPMLARLMERAYAGTVDEHLGGNNDGAVEIVQWRATGADPASSVLLHDDAGTVLAAALVSTLDATSSLLAYVITDPDHKRTGLATIAVSSALVELTIADRRIVIAAVTEGNEPSERLMNRFGFTRVN